MAKPKFDYPWLFPNFTVEEVVCRCGCGLMPQEKLMTSLQDLRDYWKVPIIVTSGARCEEHNRKVGGVSSSYHIQGLAVDVAMDRGNARDFVALATLEWFGFFGVGISLGSRTGFVHLDVREESKQALWSY